MPRHNKMKFHKTNVIYDVNIVSTLKKTFDMCMDNPQK